MYNYFPFTITDDFSGYYSTYSSTSFQIPIGTICHPTDILKFNAGTNAWYQNPETHIFLNNEVEISTLNSTNWNANLRNEWFDSFLRYANLYNYLIPSEKTTIYNYFLSKDIFQLLSSPSIAYVSINDGTNGVYNNSIITNEISIGVNVYHFNWVMDYVNTLPNNTPLKNKVFTYIKDNLLISNVCKVKYKNFEDFVWCFDGIEYPDYDISNIGLIPSLSNGGGNIFGEIKMAGNGVQAHYIVKKNIDPKDPTIGICSGEGKPFCMGDEIIIIDDTCFTNSSTSGWTWIGDYSNLKFEWFIADVSEPCTYYSNTSIYEILFPLRIIQFCIFDNFG